MQSQVGVLARLPASPEKMAVERYRAMQAWEGKRCRVGGSARELHGRRRAAGGGRCDGPRHGKSTVRVGNESKS